MPSSSSRLPLLLGTAAPLLLLLGLFVTTPAHAQYYQPVRQYDGYLPDGPQPSEPARMSSGFQQRPMFELGVAGGIGLGLVPMGTIDDVYFEPNGAYAFNVVAPLTLDVSGWVEFAQVFRVGLHGGGMWAVGRDEYLGYRSGGLLLEGGGGDQLQFWFGGVIGAGGLRTESADYNNNLYLYDASFFTTRFHMHVSHDVTPWTAVRLTPWVEVGWAGEERYGSTRPLNSIDIPDDPDFTMVSFGLSLSLEFHTN